MQLIRSLPQVLIKLPDQYARMGIPGTAPHNAILQGRLFLTSAQGFGKGIVERFGRFLPTLALLFIASRPGGPDKYRRPDL
jgi:hypothetical protein